MRGLEGRKVITLQFPFAGVNRREAFENQPPYSCFDALNVRPDSSRASVESEVRPRQRGGSRPGLGKAYSEFLGAPIRGMGQITIAKSPTKSSWLDGFDTKTLGPWWEEAKWRNGPPLIYPDDERRIQRGTTEVEASGSVLRKRLDDFDPDRPYSIRITIIPYAQKHWGKYRIYVMAKDPVGSVIPNCVVAEISLGKDTNADGENNDPVTSYTINGSITVFQNGAQNQVSVADQVVRAVEAELGDLVVDVANGTVNAFWVVEGGDPEVFLLASIRPEGDLGDRFGFGIAAPFLSSLALVSAFDVRYVSSFAEAPRNEIRTYISAGGFLWEDDADGALERVVGDPILASDKSTLMVERGGLLYIADYGPVLVAGIDGQFVDSGEGGGSAKYNGLASESVQDWTEYGIDIASDVVVITNGSTGVLEGNYVIKAVETSVLILEDAPVTTGSATCFFTVQKAPKVYDPVTRKLEVLTATRDQNTNEYSGLVPTGCPAVCVFRDRLVFAGPPQSPNVWFMSRQGDFKDWVYGLDDEQTAVAGSASSAGVPGEPIVALIPHSDDYLLMGCVSSMWILVGDPAFSGELNNLSRNVGIAGKKAWCYTPEGGVCWLSYDGLYYLPRGNDVAIVPLSRQAIPEELRLESEELEGLEVLLEYDVNDRGIHIAIVSQAATPTKRGRFWFFDWELRSFYPQEYPASIEPTFLFAQNNRFPNESAVWFCGRDGYLRRHFARSIQDEMAFGAGNAIRSFVYLGPFSAAGVRGDGVLHELHAILARASADVRVSLVWGDSPEEALAGESTPLLSEGGFSLLKEDGFPIYVEPETTRNLDFVFGQGSNRTFRPRRRGSFFFLRVGSAGDSGVWSMESITAFLGDAGKRRVLT